VREALRAASEDLAAAARGNYAEAVDQAIGLLEHALRAQGKLLVFGNGGSAADAQHLCAELVGRFSMERGPLAAIALTTNQALLTAWSNDYRFDDVFARQIEALGRPGDVALAISTSGNSPNVLRGLERARARGLKTIGLGGQGGGSMGPLCDVLLSPPVSETPRIQQVHLVTYHAICAELERRLLA
jgi:D-sedoheptulose 7-phosphate isomerase